MVWGVFISLPLRLQADSPRSRKARPKQHVLKVFTGTTGLGFTRDLKHKKGQAWYVLGLGNIKNIFFHEHGDRGWGQKTLNCWKEKYNQNKSTTSCFSTYLSASKRRWTATLGRRQQDRTSHSTRRRDSAPPNVTQKLLQRKRLFHPAPPSWCFFCLVSCTLRHSAKHVSAGVCSMYESR